MTLNVGYNQFPLCKTTRTRRIVSCRNDASQQAGAPVRASRQGGGRFGRQLFLRLSRLLPIGVGDDAGVGGGGGGSCGGRLPVYAGLHHQQRLLRLADRLHDALLVVLELCEAYPARRL